jgi:tetratricopeptide (TPR) repeat protein
LLRTPQWREAKRRIDEAKQRGRDKSREPTLRAKAWREAAVAALEGLRRPELAASYARRAERLDPNDAEAVVLLALSLRRAERYRALERFLWRRLATDPAEGAAGYERALQELLNLYQGPLRRPEIASGLRRIVDSKSS